MYVLYVLPSILPILYRYYNTFISESICHKCYFHGIEIQSNTRSGQLNLTLHCINII